MTGAVGVQRAPESEAATMHAVVLAEHGGPERLRSERRPVPEMGPREALVRVRACGVCGHDLLARAGKIPMPVPQVLGHEVAGEVVAVDSEVAGLSVGDRVALTPMMPCGRCEACLNGDSRTCRVRGGLYGEQIPGGYAEYVLANEFSAVRLPEEIDFVSGSILGCAVASALRAVRRGRLRMGETVLVTGATGGVGIHLVQLAKAAGARVIAATASSEKAPALRQAGSDEVVVTAGGFEAEVRELTRGRGVDVILDNVGAPTLQSCLRALRTTGRLVLIGNVKPLDLPVGLGQLIMKEFELIGTARPGREELRQSIALVETGKVRPWVARTFPLEEAEAAHRHMEERGAVGRCVLVVE